MRKSRCFIWVMGVLLGLSFVFAGPPVRAAEKTEIHINAMFDLTGPYSGVHQLLVNGYKDMCKWTNDMGLVPGANIVLDIVDTGSEVSKGIVGYQMAANRKPRAVVSTGGQASNVAIALKQYAKRLKIPLYGGGSTRTSMVPPAWNFAHQGCYEGQVAACGRWAKANWRPDSDDPWIRAHYEKRNPRIAIMGWDNAFGRGPEQKETKDYLEKIGVDFVGAEYIPMSPSDTTPQLLRLVKDKKTDFIYFVMYPSSIGVILKDAARLGLRDDFQDFSFWAASIIQLRKYVGDLANRSMMLTGYKLHPDEWEIPYFADHYKKSNAPLMAAVYYSAGASFLGMKVEAIRRAAKKVGVKNVDGQSVYNALINMKNYRPFLYHSTQSFSKTKRIGPDDAVMYQIQDGELKVIAKDIPVPDLLPGGKDVVK